jgi:hypothetical protein
MHRSSLAPIGPAALAAALFLAACQPGAAPAPAPPPAPAPVPKPAEPPQNVAGLLREYVAIEPGNRAVPLVTDGHAVIHPQSTFRVVLSRRSPDVRLALLDPSDAVVAAEGGKELAEGTTLTQKPSAPLVPTGIYLLRLDGVASREVHDESGAAYQPMSVTVQVSGEAPAAKPAGKRKR